MRRCARPSRHSSSRRDFRILRILSQDEMLPLTVNPDNTQTGHIEIRQLGIVPLPHRRFRNGKFNQGGNKHHETKTNTYQHSGSSIRVPIDGDVRSASSELRLYRSDHDFRLSWDGKFDLAAKD